VFAKLAARFLLLPIAATAANKWKAKETPPARNAKPPRFAESTKYPRSKLDSALVADRVYLFAVGAEAATPPPTSTVRRSTASVDSS